MAAKKAKASGAGLAADSGAVIPRINLGETGFVGLRTTNSTIIEEANRVFRYPQFLKTVSEMRTDPTVSAALNVYRMMISRVKWTVQPPPNASETDKQRAAFAQSVMSDMEGTWPQFISEVVTYLEYGFSVQEKVFRRRLKRNGSKYNDGLVGLRKIAPRSQDTIRHWNFSEDGRELLSVGQSLRNMENGSRYQGLTDAKDGLLNIDRSKFLLFSADSVKGNPEGKSILKSVYLPYKQLSLLKDQLMLGISKDLAAIPIVGLPPKMMDANASPEDKAAYLAYQSLVNNVANGTQRGIVMPLMYDQDSKLPLFDFKLLEAKGNSKFDLPAIIKQLQADVLLALSVDVITVSPDMQGTFSIKDTKTNLCAMAVEHRLNEIRDVLNGDLLAQLYALNGWSQENMPTFEFGDIADVDSEAFSKLVQRVASVGLLEIDREVLNKIRDVMGVVQLPADTPVDKENLTGASSKSGAGMEPGTTGDGTAKIGGKSKKTDKSASNADNAA
jgi:hypothetical protein